MLLVFDHYLGKRDVGSKNNFYLEVFNDDSIKFFVNFKEIENEEIKLHDGDELGILPPVTGG